MEDATIADLPAEVVALLTPELCEEMAATFCDRIYYPRFIAIETPDDDEFDFPGLSEPVLYLFGEDQGIMDVLALYGRAGRVDIRRVLVLRTASNYTREGDGLPQMLEFTEGGAGAAFEAAYLVGAPVVKALVAGWDRYATTIPQAKP